MGIRKVSKKRAAQNREYKKLRAEYTEKHPYCEARGLSCTFYATDLHHKNHRNGERLNDVSNFMAVCRGCHNWIHAHPAEARAKGWLI